MTPDEIKRRFPNASPAFIAANSLAPRLPPKEPQPQRKPLEPAQAQKGREAGVAVIFTRCASRRLDRDNLWASIKPLCDALREAGHIPNDTEQDIELFVFQKKVKRKEAGTLIEIVKL